MLEISVCHSNIFVVGSLRMKIVAGGRGGVRPGSIHIEINLGNC